MTVVHTIHSHFPFVFSFLRLLNDFPFFLIFVKVNEIEIHLEKRSVQLYSNGCLRMHHSQSMQKDHRKICPESFKAEEILSNVYVDEGSARFLTALGKTPIPTKEKQ